MAHPKMARLGLTFLGAAALWAPALQAQQQSQVCSFCHLTVYLDAQRRGHEKFGVSCFECHGESLGHRNAEDNKVKPSRTFKGGEVVGLCAECHAAKPQSKPAAPGLTIELFEKSKHAKPLRGASGPSCVTCHGAHGFFTAAQQEKVCAGCHPNRPAACRAPVKGAALKLRCSACHEPHSLGRPVSSGGRNN